MNLKSLNILEGRIQDKRQNFQEVLEKIQREASGIKAGKLYLAAKDALANIENLLSGENSIMNYQIKLVTLTNEFLRLERYLAKNGFFREDGTVKQNFSLIPNSANGQPSLMNDSVYFLILTQYMEGEYLGSDLCAIRFDKDRYIGKDSYLIVDFFKYLYNIFI